MKDYGTQRSTAKPNATVVDDFSVWVHSNITEVSENLGADNEFVGFEFDMVQYSKDEYIMLMDESNKENQRILTNLLGVN